jgi:hypothetical protein
MWGDARWTLVFAQRRAMRVADACELAAEEAVEHVYPVHGQSSAVSVRKSLKFNLPLHHGNRARRGSERQARCCKPLAKHLRWTLATYLAWTDGDSLLCSSSCCTSTRVSFRNSPLRSRFMSSTPTANRSPTPARERVERCAVQSARDRASCAVLGCERTGLRMWEKRTEFTTLTQASGKLSDAAELPHFPDVTPTVPRAVRWRSSQQNKCSTT